MTNEICAFVAYNILIIQAFCLGLFRRYILTIIELGSQTPERQ